MMENLKRIVAVPWVFLIICDSSALMAQEKDLDVLTNWLQGTFSNENQFKEGRIEKASDLLFPVFRKVGIPVFGDHVIYFQWPIGSPDGDLQRQRIWTFHTDETGRNISMTFFTLRDPEKWRDAHLEPQKVRNMTLDDTIGYPDTCILPVTRDGDGFVLRIPAACEIVSQGSQITMTLQSETTIDKGRITYREAGFQPDGSVVFQTPSVGRYEFDRLSD